MKRIHAIAACAVAAGVLSACGSSQSGIVTPHRMPQSLTFVAKGRPTSRGVDNRDLYTATMNGKLRDVSASESAETNAAWSADGRHVVFIRTSTDGQSNGHVGAHTAVFVWSPGQGEPHRIAGCSDSCDSRTFAWSPDDRRIAFFSGGQYICNYGSGMCAMYDGAIKVMNADGSHVHAVCGPKRCGNGSAPPDPPVAWSPDSRRLLFTNDSSFGSAAGAIWIANADGSGVRMLTHTGSDSSPTWSPSGSQIAFTRVSRSSPSLGFHSRPSILAAGLELEVMNADGTHLRTLGHCGFGCRPAWSPSSRTIASLKRLGMHAIELTTLRGKTSLLRTCAGSRCVTPSSDPIWSPDGRRLAFFAAPDGREGHGIWVIRRNGSGLRRITHVANSCCLAWIRRSGLARAVQRPSS